MTDYALIAIPLRRPEIVDFLLPPDPQTRGALLTIIGQRPSAEATAAWIDHLQATDAPTVADLLRIDDPHGNLVAARTDRLVPVQFLRQQGFLTRNLGGWSPIYFAVAGLPENLSDDPLLNRAEVLLNYGRRIRAFGADPAQVAGRLAEETGSDVVTLAADLERLARVRRQMAGQPTALAERLYAETAAGTHFASDYQPPIARLLLLDALLDEMVGIELTRRAADANGDEATAERIAVWQKAQQAQTGLMLILKGEYIMSRHRRSTILIAPELGAVIKQPAPEPFHEIELDARQFGGEPENWPYPTGDGALVTSRGRLRLVVEEGLAPRLNEIFVHPVRFSTLMGLIVEPFIDGPTAQEMVRRDPARLTPELYEVFILHQQVCELIGAENGDWHAANFMQRPEDGTLVHIDWGAARPLRPDELTPEGRQARLDQVRNIAYSFHDESLAEQTLALHDRLTGDAEWLTAVRRRAKEWVASNG